MWSGMNFVNEFIIVIIGFLKLLFCMFVVCYSVWVVVIWWLKVVVLECRFGILLFLRVLGFGLD